MPAETTLFPREIEDSLEEVRARCGMLIDAICGSGARAKDVSDRLEVHSKLGWQLWSVAYSPPLAALRYLPNPHGIKLIADAANAKGLPSEVVAKLTRAAEELNRVMETHAPDREMFEMMLDAREPGNEESELKWRRQAFVGNAFCFGARARCMLATAIIYPGRHDGTFSLVRIHGLIDLIRTRAGVRWPFATLVVQRDGSSSSPVREPLNPGESESSLLTKYCSKPLPPIERRSEGDFVSDELLPGPVGLTGAATVFTGEVLHDVGPIKGSSPGEVAHFGTGLRTPCEVLVSDHIVHRKLFPGAQRELRVFSELVSSVTRDERDRLEVSESLQRLGLGIDRIRTADVPNYAELLEGAFKRIDCDPADFEVYRVTMRYPPIPTSLMVRFEMPPP